MTGERTVYKDRIGSSTKKKQRRTWRDWPDAHWHGYPCIPSAPSLHPDLRVIGRYVHGDPTAIAIVEAWNPAVALRSLIKVVPA